MKFLALTACFVLAACGEAEPVAPPSGVAPDSSPKISTVTRPAVELSEPIEPTPAPTTEPIPVTTAPAPKIAFEIDPLGRFEVITWDEAARRAEQKITVDTAMATLRALRQDVLGRRR